MRTVDRASGRWRTILPALGIDRRFLENKHGPCPLCGGKDRFRFDDKNGEGTYFCNQCGPGTGLMLVRKLNGWDHATACREVDKIIGRDPHPRAEPPTETRTSRARLQALLAEASRPDLVEHYLRRRGLSTVPDVLRGHPRLPYTDNGRYLGCFPAMLASVTGPDGSLQSVLRTYLDDDVPVRKKLLPPVETVRGAAVRLFDPTTTLGIAEGVETAIGAHELFHVPVWAALSTVGLESFVPPPGTTRLFVYADHDANFAGQKAAFALAHRLSRERPELAVDVAVPPTAGTDWLDVLLERSMAA